MKRLLCVVVCLLALVHIAKAQTRLEMRLAETAPGAGLTAVTIPASGQKIYLHESSVITNADVIDAHVANDADGRPSVAIRLTPDAGARLENATREHLGKPIAILVNGVVVSAPRVDGVIGREAQIFGRFTQTEVEEIAAGLMGR